jgi:hypothetical protein
VKGLEPSAVVSTVGVFEDLDYTRPCPLEAEHAIRLEVKEAGRLDGLLVWLNLYTLGQDECIDILRDEHCWLPVYLPVFGADPVTVPTGARIEATIRRTLCDNGRNPDFFLQGRVVHGTRTLCTFDYASPHKKDRGLTSPFYQALFRDGIPRRDGRPLSPDSLRAHLAERLPRAMVPARYVTLDAWPLSPNGKVDRRALSLQSADGPSDFVPPRDPMERLVASLWEEILGCPSVGVQDDFFALGGHSLMATRLISGLRQALHVDVPLRCVFDTPRLEDFAAVVAERHLASLGDGAIDEILSGV